MKIRILVKFVIKQMLRNLSNELDLILCLSFMVKEKLTIGMHRLSSFPVPFKGIVY